MVRVLQVVTHMNRGGLESFLMNYYRHIDRSLIQFDFLTHREYDGDFGEEIVSLGGKIYHLPVLNPFSRKYKSALIDFFTTHPEYKIIHVHQDCMSSVILRIAEECGVPVRLAHSHSASQNKDIKYPLKLLFKKLIPRYSTGLFACGNDAGNWMFNGAPFEIINNSIDAEEYGFDIEKRQKIRADLGIDSKEFVIGHVGSFTYPKNHSFLLDIFFELQKRDKVRLLLVGDGSGRKAIENKIRELGLSESVIMTGLRNDVADLMQAMDIFVLPSRYEGLPVVMIEAQAAGLPCIISDRVPMECKITEAVLQVSLRSTVKEWVDNIIKFNNFERKNNFQTIKEAGFDVVENSYLLQKYYLNVVEGD